MSLLSISELTTYRWSFEEDVRNYSAAGFRAIGVWRQKLSDFGEERGLALLHDSGLEVSSLLWAGGFTGSDGHSTAARVSADGTSVAFLSFATNLAPVGVTIAAGGPDLYLFKEGTTAPLLLSEREATIVIISVGVQAGFAAVLMRPSVRIARRPRTR